jgi:hypothetical protein
MPYEPGTVDFFFITTGDRRLYLIPLEAVRGFTDVSLTNKYAAFEVTFRRPGSSVGSGLPRPGFTRP